LRAVSGLQKVEIAPVVFEVLMQNYKFALARDGPATAIG
jgi:hypothetical protein